MKRLFSLASAAALFLAACCPLVSTNPLSSQDDAQFDQRLEGTWVHNSDEGEVGYLHIGKTKGNLTKAISVEIKKNGELDHMVFTLFPTIVANNNFLNIKTEHLFEGLPPERQGYIFARYEHTGDHRLSLYIMDNGPFEKAVQSGILKGEITYKESAFPDADAKEKKIECVQITDSSENILNFIMSHDPAIIFPEEIKLKKQTAKKPD